MAKKKIQQQMVLKDSRHFVEHKKKSEKQWQTFDEFWAYIKRARKLNDNMKIHLRAYFQSLGLFSKPSEYESALKKFGL